MMQSFRRTFAVSLVSAGILTLSFLAGAVTADKTGDLFPDPVVAKGKNFQIKQSQVEEAFIAFKANMAARGQPVPESDRVVMESNLLQRLILTEVLMGRATAEDKAKGKETTDKFLAGTKKQFPSEEAYKAQVRATGMTMDQFQTRALEQNICELVLERELKSKISVSDSDVKKFYDENQSKFEAPEQVRASHILISTKDKLTKEQLSPEKKREKEKLIRDLKARAEKGEDFAKLAKEFSEDPGSKDKGGEYTFGRGVMVRDFEAAAFSLKPNQISDVVETEFGYHIIKLWEKIPPKVQEFAKVSDTIKEYLTSKEFQNRVPDYLEKAKKDASVELVPTKNSEKK